MNLYDEVRRIESDYTSGEKKIGRYVSFDMYKTIELTDAYLNSQFEHGKTDSLGREKPFFNIVVSASNIWFRATDIDRKDIRILATSRETAIPAFILTILLQEWMRKNNFGQFLNDWGLTLARYGSALVKFVEVEGELIATVVPWNRVITDPIDFDSVPRIEKFYKSEQQLINMSTKGHPEYSNYFSGSVKNLIESASSSRKTLNGEQMDSINSNFLELYEVHGVFSEKVLKEAKGEEPKNGDENIYSQQVHIITWNKDKNGKLNNYTIYAGKETQDPYLLTHLFKEPNRTLGKGAVELLFDSQWMVNHSIKQAKDYLELASKLLFQTADENYIDRNVLTSIETGSIFIHAPNKPLTQISNSAQNFSAIQAFNQQWRTLGQDITSTPDAFRGNTLPSGTPYSLGALLNQGPTSLFETMTENKGLELERMLDKFVIPHLMKKMDTSEEISAILSEKNIEQLDKLYVPDEAVRRHNRKFVQAVINEQPLPTFDQKQGEEDVRNELNQFGNMRFLKPSDISTTTWKKVLKNLKPKTIIEITNEPQDKQALLTTLSSTLKDLASIVQNPTLMENPMIKSTLGRLLTLTGGISPLEFPTK